MAVLDLGTGTGALAERLSDTRDVDLWGADFSEEMLARARTRIPSAHFVQVDLLASCWPADLTRRFDRIVSGYVFHEFDLAAKLSLLQRLADDYLAPEGRIVIGDIAFPTVETRAAAQQRWEAWWGEDEAYWAADEVTPALSALGLDVTYRQVSACAGVFTLTRRHDEGQFGLVRGNRFIDPAAASRPTLRAPSRPRHGLQPRQRRARPPARVGRSGPACGDAHLGPRGPRSPGALRRRRLPSPPSPGHRDRRPVPRTWLP